MRTHTAPSVAGLLLCASLALLPACSGRDTEAALAELSEGHSRTRSRSGVRSPLAAIDTTPPSPELLAQLRSDEPIPATISVPVHARPTFDARAFYIARVRALGAERLMVRVLELVPVGGGSIARVQVLRSSSDRVARTEFFFPDGLACEFGDIRVGQTFLIHVATSQLLAPGADVVPVMTVGGSPTIVRGYRGLDGAYQARFPWGDESFSSLLAG